MTEERLRDLLRSALPLAAGQGPSRDLWPLVLDRIQARADWAWFDMSLAAGVAIMLLMFPKALFLLAYHL